MAKPKKNHPWKNVASSEAVAWARRESHINDVRTVTVANAKTWSNYEEAYYKRSQH